MNQSLIAKEVMEVAKRCDLINLERNHEQIRIIQTLGDDLDARIDELSRPLREKLKEKVNLYDIAGTPPSILWTMGESHLEKPFNRILKWCSDVNAEHKFGREFLKLLATKVALPELKDDLTNNQTPEVYGEEAVDHSGNMPDLVILTLNSALLLENKVHAPESGNQYHPYRDWFRKFIGNRKMRLVLSARDERDVPDEWDLAITHNDIAEIFRSLARLECVPLWGRIVAVQCAVAFSNDTPIHTMETIDAARQLISETAAGSIAPDRLGKLRALQSIPFPSMPWLPDKNEHLEH